MPDLEIGRVSERIINNRRRILGIYDKLVKHEYEIDPEGEAKAEGMINNGQGMMIVANHPTKMDGPEETAYAWRNRLMVEREISAPVALHQYPLAWALNFLCKTEMNLDPVLTEHTAKILPILKKYVGWGNDKYVANGIRVLKAGGIMPFFPQAGRTPHIGDKKTIALEYFFRKTTKQELDDFGLITMGISVLGMAPEKAKGLNFGHTYLIKTGQTYTKYELIEIKNRKQVRSVDEVIWKEIERLVTEEFK
jgi:hypothetical protein